MGKHKHIKTHHLYLGAGGVVAVVALVVALTFGLSSAQTYTPPPDSGTYTPPPDSGTYTPPPDSGTYTPPPSCPSGQWWDFAANVCKTSDTGGQTGTYVPPATGTYTTPPSCPSGQWWDFATNMCKSSDMSGGQIGTYPSPTNMPACAPGVMPTAASPCQMPPPPSCPSGQWYNYSTSSCTSSTMPPPVNTVQCTSPMQPFPGPNGQSACYDPATLPTCSSTVTSACKPQGWVAPTQTQGQQPGQCPQGQYWDFALNSCKSATTQPTTQTQCGQGLYWDFMKNSCQSMQPQQDQWKQVAPETQQTYQMQPGQCPQDMMSCSDPWMPGNKICQPKKFFQWDQKTQKSTEKDMTCESWAAYQKEEEAKWKDQGPGMGMGMGDQGMQGQMPWFGTDMKGHDMGKGQKDMDMKDYCKYYPKDLSCMGGFDFGAMQDQYKFDESQFVPEQGKEWGKNQLKQELKNLKQEAKSWIRDAKEIRARIKEVSRESSGFACPTVVEVNTIAQQFEDAATKVSALTELSETSEIQNGLALRDFMNGKWENGEQVSEGLRQKLYGGPPNEDGEQTPGKMQSLDGCRELSNIVRDSCSMAKDITREAEKAKKSKAPEEVIKVFDEVLAGLNLRCKNPLAALPAGVSADELFKPFRPDPDVCGEFMYGPGGPGGPGPMPMQFEQMMGGQGGQGGFDPEMMKKMEEKFMEMQKGQGNFQGFNPFGASVLSAQAFGDEDFEGGPGFGPPKFGPPEGMPRFNEPPEECMPPAQRYLSPHRLMRKLEEIRGAMDKQFENMNVCSMLDMAKDFIESEDAEGPNGPPPEVIDLVQSGVWQEACDSNDAKTLAKIKAKLMRLGPPGGRGPGQVKGPSFGGMIDIDKLVEDKLNEKLGSLFGLEKDEEANDETAAQMKMLEQRIADLQSKLDDATKTILALNDRLSEMATKLAAVVELNESATTAVGSIAKLPDETVQTGAIYRISALADKVDEAKRVLPPEEDKKIDTVFNALIVSPPSSQVIEQMTGKLNEIISSAQSGAKKADLREIVEDKVAEITVLNIADVDNKVREGSAASRDTADLSKYFAVPALNLVKEGFASITKDNPDFKPAEPETKCAAITRVARIAEKATGEKIDMSDKTLDRPVPGAPDWCLPFISHLQEQNVPFVESLKDPNATIDRVEIAVLIHQAIGDRLPDPPSISEYLPRDTKNLPVDQQVAIAEIEFNGIMSTTDGTNFSPRDDFLRAQNAVVTDKTYKALVAAEENRE